MREIDKINLFEYTSPLLCIQVTELRFWGYVML